MMSSLCVLESRQLLSSDFCGDESNHSYDPCECPVEVTVAVWFARASFVFCAANLLAKGYDNDWAICLVTSAGMQAFAVTHTIHC